MAGLPPLHGVRVVDISQIGAGPYATSWLGDFGADVVKVEPLAGDPLRYLDDAFEVGTSAYFASLNRSKRAIAVDLKTPEGRQVLDKLLDGADVFVASMRPAALARLGLDYESLAPRFPALVHCTLTAFGESGPLSPYPGIDGLAQALGGIMGTTGEPGRTPIKTGPAIADFVGAFHLCLAVVLALRAKDRDGQGQRVSVNLLDGQVSMMPNLTTTFQQAVKRGLPGFELEGGAHAHVVPYQAFLASDDWFVVACSTQRFWVNFCTAIGRTDLLDDERFATNELRVQNRSLLVPGLERLMLERPRAEWVALFRGADVPCAPVNRVQDVMNDLQILHNQMLLELEHPRLGTIRTVANPLKLHSTPTRSYGYPPDLGEHTRDVLKELGYGEEDVVALLNAGVIRTA